MAALAGSGRAVTGGRKTSTADGNGALDSASPNRRRPRLNRQILTATGGKARAARQSPARPREIANVRPR